MTVFSEGKIVEVARTKSGIMIGRKLVQYTFKPYIAYVWI